MPRNQENKNRPGKQPTVDTHEQARTAKEEISYLRQRFGSMMMRGHYRECFKLIEDNIQLLYFQERWPENFLNSLRNHKRCYTSMDIAQPYEEYLTALLKKNNLPVIFVQLMKGQEKIDWSGEHFKNLTLEAKAAKDFENALGYCELMIKVDPTNSNGFLLKGWILEDMGRDADAAEAFQLSLDINETNYQAWKSLAEHYLKTDPRQALDYINKALEMAPAEGDFHAIKARILSKTGDADGAVTSINKAIALEPLNGEYLFRKGELLLQQGQTLGALRQYAKSVAIDGRNIPALMRLATLFSKDQPEMALPHITAVVGMEPDNVEAMLLRASLLRRTGDIGAAAKQLNKVLAKDPNCAPAHAGLGRIYLEVDPEKSLCHYGQAVSLDSGNAQYHLGKAQALEQLRQDEAAIQEYNAALSLDKNIAKAHAALGRYCLESKPADAVAHLDKAIALDPENPYYHQGRGEALARQGGRLADAVASLNKAVQLDPGNSGMRLRLAQLLELMGNFISATEHYRFAASLDISNVEAHYGLARLLLESEPNVALEHINKAIALDSINGEYFYIKALVLDKLGTRKDSLLQLKNALPENAATENMEELSQVLGGESPRVALMYINRAIELSPGNSRYICARANLLYNVGNITKALEQYQQVLKLDADNHEALYGMGRIQAAKGDRKSLETLGKAISLAPDIPTYRVARAALLGQDPETYAQALAEYDAAIAINNQQWWVILEKAKLLDTKGDFVGAAQHYRRVLLIHPSCLEATARMGMLLADRNPAGALNYLDRAISMDPETGAYHMYKAKAFYNQRNVEQAEMSCRIAIDLSGTGDDTYFRLAKLFQGNQAEVALKYIGVALDIAGNKWEYHLLCGEIYESLSNQEDAIKSYGKVLELKGNCHEALGKLADIYFAQSNQACLELINRALAIAPNTPDYLYSKTRMLDEMQNDTAAAIETINHAVKVDPDSLLCREKLVALLTKNKNRVRLFMENGKLEKLRKKIQQMEAAASAMAQDVEPPPEVKAQEPLPHIPTPQEAKAAKRAELEAALARTEENGNPAATQTAGTTAR